MKPFTESECGWTHRVQQAVVGGPRRPGFLEEVVMAGPQAGDRAPDFVLMGTSGEVRLADRLAEGPVVLVFYTEDNTPT